jgi:hypothetical protein
MTTSRDTTTDYLWCSPLSGDATNDYLLYSTCRYVSRRSRLWISRRSLPAASRRSRRAVSCWRSRRWLDWANTLETTMSLAMKCKSERREQATDIEEATAVQSPKEDEKSKRANTLKTPMSLN